MEEDKKKLTITAMAVLLVTGTVSDILSLIPFVGDAVGPLFWGAVLYYFWKKGYGFINWGRIATSTISTVAELIPAVQELPTIALGIVLVIIINKIEEKTGISVTSIMGKGKPGLNSGGTRVPHQKVPLNQNGVRAPRGGMKDPDNPLSYNKRMGSAQSMIGLRDGHDVKYEHESSIEDAAELHNRTDRDLNVNNQDFGGNNEKIQGLSTARERNKADIQQERMVKDQQREMSKKG